MNNRSMKSASAIIEEILREEIRMFSIGISTRLRQRKRHWYNIRDRIPFITVSDACELVKEKLTDVLNDLSARLTFKLDENEEMGVNAVYNLGYEHGFNDGADRGYESGLGDIVEIIINQHEELTNVITRVCNMFDGDVGKVREWLCTENPMLGDFTPTYLISIGKIRQIVRFLDERDAGYYP